MIAEPGGGGRLKTEVFFEVAAEELLQAPILGWLG
jgi:hypothetical protein